MLEFLQEIDRVLFEFLNGKLHNTFLDWLMPIITNANTWIPLYVGLLIYMVYRYRKLFFIPFLGLLVTFGVTDPISAKVLKPIFERTRPCNESTVNSRVVGVECRNSYSFPSSHASNHFGIAVFMAVLIGTRKRFGLGFWMVWAGMISYSRIYVGVHYPFDILSGAILGSSIGLFFALVTNKILNKIKNNNALTI
ncbi:MAG: phosphatase PAP2 family protein [Bacteroidetes bacterium]|nr:phosphatase PAP2 family protein [Bacteroidota bacterium]